LGVSLQQFCLDLKEPWQKALLILALVPLFPDYISFFLIIAATVFAMMEIRASKKKIQIGFIGKILMLFCAFQLISTTYSNSPLHTLVTAAMWWFFFLVYLIVTNLVNTAARFDGFLLCITGVAGLVGLIACIQYRIGTFTDSNPIYFWSWLDNLVYEFLPLELSKTPYALRAASTFSNPNILAEYLVAVAPFVVYFNFCERRKEIRIFCRVCLFLTFGGIIFSFSRGGYLALLLLCAALIVLNIRHRFAAVSMYVFSAILFLPEEVIKRLWTIGGGISSGSNIIENAINSSDLSYEATTEIINNAGAEFAVSERWKIWLESLASFVERPIGGYGAGTHATWEVFDEVGISAVHAHNLVLQIMLEGGIIALVLMMIMGFKSLKNGVELIRGGYNSNSFWIGFSILSFAACFMLHGMVDHPLLTPKLVCNFIMILGIIECSSKIYTGRKFSVWKKIKHRLVDVKKSKG